MLYYLFEYLDLEHSMPGAGLFKFITFRAMMAMVVSLVIAKVYGTKIIDFIRNKSIGESIRDLGLTGQMEKQGTPTMGGIIIIACILIPTLLFARLQNVYIILLIITTVWLGLIGFIDDYIKVFKKNKEGLSGKFKIVGQIFLGVTVGLVLYYNDHVVVREYLNAFTGEYVVNTASGVYRDVKSTFTTLPFMKDQEMDYSIFTFGNEDLTWIVYVFLATFVIAAVSNGANMTDGIDGLAAGSSAIIGVSLAILAYVSGNTIFADYLNIMFIPESGEIVIFCAAFIGACIGFLWYNSYPAQVFMGDTGSLSLGGIIAVIALSIRKEWLVPVLCGIFFIENLSVILQVGYFKYTKNKYGEGRRIFKMAPLHHHYQKSGYHESKIVTRFWIVGILLALVAVATLKVR